MAKDLSKYIPGRCESDIRRLKSDVGAVMSDLDEFRMRMADVGIRLDETGSQVMSAGAGFDDTDTRMSGSAVDGDERAFEVFGVEFDDSGAEKEQIDKWTVYVPSGCVQIDGVAVNFDNEVSEDRVSISPDVKGGVTLHCVVWKDKDGTAHAKICVGNGERDTLVGNIGSNGGTLYASVPFCTLSDTYEDNNQIHLGAIVLTSSGGGGDGFSMDVTDVDVTGTTDHPNGGVKVTLSPSAGQGTDFTVWNGKDGNDGSDAVVDAYSERISGTPGRTRVTLTPNNGGNQTQFDVLDGADASVDVDSVDVSPSLDHPNGGVKVTLTPNVGAGSWFNVWNGKDGASVSSVDVDGEPYTDGGYTITKLRITFDDGRSSTVDISARTGGLSGTISYVSDVKYDYDSHSIQKQTSTMNLATGAVNVGQWITVEGGVAASHNSDIKD